ncbi:YbhB/YbcL family Raf kinase inhibitor-like protein [bacterium]|nr:YbhB/YbcL family Raf kinase inhibitor-like protein [bacterium]
MKLALTFLFSSSLFAAPSLKVSSHTLKAGTQMNESQVFNGFGCKGENISPDLTWSGAPSEAKAFAVTMYDPDAPTGSGWWHWTLFNIPSTVNSLEAGASSPKASLPAGAIEARTDFGKTGYGGPCPPPGKPHRYIFKVYALKEPLPLDKEASGAAVGFYVNQMKLAEGTLEAKYGRK